MSQQYVKDEYPLSDVTARIIAAATEVHHTLGPGFEEVIYQRALALELPAHDLEFSREVWMDVTYKGVKVGRKRVDFVIDEVMVEIKAQAALEDVDFFASVVVPESVWLQGGAVAQLWSQKVADQATGELSGSVPSVPFSDSVV